MYDANSCETLKDEIPSIFESNKDEITGAETVDQIKKINTLKNCETEAEFYSNPWKMEMSSVNVSIQWTVDIIDIKEQDDNIPIRAVGGETNGIEVVM